MAREELRRLEQWHAGGSVRRSYTHFDFRPKQKHRMHNLPRVKPAVIFFFKKKRAESASYSRRRCISQVATGQTDSAHLMKFTAAASITGDVFCQSETGDVFAASGSLSHRSSTYG